jgi:hypothetical protein
LPSDNTAGEPTHGRPIDFVFTLAMAVDRAEHVEQPVKLLGWF